MIELEITSMHFEADDKLRRYAGRKIGKLDKYLPRQQRGPARGQVVLLEEPGRAKNRFVCDVTLEFPHGSVTAKEATISMYAAIDIVEEKIKAQLLKYKDKKQHNRRARRGKRMLKGFRFNAPWNRDKED